MLGVAIFGELAEWRYFRHSLGSYCAIICAIWPFSNFAAMLMLVLLMFFVNMTFFLTFFTLYSENSLEIWREVSLPRRILILVGWTFLTIWVVRLAVSETLAGLAIMALTWGLIGWFAREAALIAMNTRDKKIEGELNQ